MFTYKKERDIYLEKKLKYSSPFFFPQMDNVAELRYCATADSGSGAGQCVIVI